MPTKLLRFATFESKEKTEDKKPLEKEDTDDTVERTIKVGTADTKADYKNDKKLKTDKE